MQYAQIEDCKDSNAQIKRLQEEINRKELATRRQKKKYRKLEKEMNLYRLIKENLEEDVEELQNIVREQDEEIESANEIIELLQKDASWLIKYRLEDAQNDIKYLQEDIKERDLKIEQKDDIIWVLERTVLRLKREKK